MADRITQLFHDWWPIFLLALAAVSGLGGGCTTAILHMAQGKQDFKIAMIAAYGFIGLVNAVLAFVFVNYLVGTDNINTVRLVGASFIWGVISTAVLFTHNVTARWTLKVMGKEVVELNAEQQKATGRKK